LVVEVGFRETDSGTNFFRFGALVFGDDSATDLPEDQTTTTADNPWIEFSGDLFAVPTVELAARFELGLEQRASIQQTAMLAARFVLGMDARVDPDVIREIAARFVLGLEALADAQAITQTEVAARFVLALQSRTDIEVTRVLAARFVLALGMSTDAVAFAIVEAAARFVLGLEVRGAVEPAGGFKARFVLGLGARAELLPVVNVAARFELGLGVSSPALIVTRQLAARFELGLDPRVRYRGPGTGLVVSQTPDQRRRLAIARLAAGDTTRVVIPHGGQAGIAGVARVMSRAVDDSRAGVPRLDPALFGDEDVALDPGRRTAGQSVRVLPRGGIRRALGD
jgi:hypothetical protein